METRTTRKQVQFRKPFYLSALRGAQPPGCYAVRVDHERAGAAGDMGWRRTDIVLELAQDGRMTDVTMSAQELREALVQDGGQGTDPPANPGVSRRG